MVAWSLWCRMERQIMGPLWGVSRSSADLRKMKDYR